MENVKNDENRQNKIDKAIQSAYNKKHETDFKRKSLGGEKRMNPVKAKKTKQAVQTGAKKNFFQIWMTG